MTTILLTGTYSSFNRGDAAMQMVMARELRAALPGADVVIHAPFPAADARYYQDARVVGSSRRQLIRATLAVAWLIVRRVLVARAASPALLPTRELREIAGADLVVDLSGDMLTEEHGLHLTYSHCLPLIMAHLLDRPVFVCAQSIGPFRRSRRLVRRVLGRARAVTARESVTLAYLADPLRLDPRRVERTADLAFLLEPAPASRVDEILRAEGVDAARDFIGVSVSGIVAATHARHRGSGAAFADAVAAALDAVQERTGARIVFVAHVTGPRASKDDRRVARAVWERMRRRDHAVVLGGDYPSDELKGVIARATVFAGARMHANIAALSSGVPVLAISYSHKTPGIMQSMGVADWVLDARALTTDGLAGRLEQLWAERREVAACLQSRLDGTRAAARRNIEIALDLLARGTEREPGEAPRG